MRGTTGQVRRSGRRAPRAVLTTVVLCAVAAASCTSTSGTATGGSAPSTGTPTASGTTTVKGSVAPSTTKDWPSYGHDLANTRRNDDEKKITPASVATLKQQWTKGDMVGVTGTPTVAAGIAYFGDWKGVVHAVKADTGDEVWASTIGGMIVGAPAIDGDGVYASSGHTLYRLDRATGAQKWKTDVHDHPLAQINASPVVVGNLVFQGVASAEVVMARPEYTFRGSIGAYDTTTGQQVWNFFTTDNDPAGGAGVGVWSTPAVDVERGVLYVGTGNNYAEPTSKLADSIIALDLKTGKLEWSRQFTYPDVFSGSSPKGKDADVGASPNLWTSDGRALVGAGDKGGVYHALDRDTGELAWETTLTPGSVFGGEIGSGAFVDGKLVVVSNVGDPATNSPTNVAKVFALDPATGAVLWKTDDYPGKIFAPVGAVPGLAFIGTDTGVLAALDTQSGKQLWTVNAPDKTGCGPSIVDGRVLWGYGFVLFKGGGQGGIISFGVA